MTVQIRQGIRRDEATYIVYNLRDRDREEIYATRFHDDPVKLIDEICIYPDTLAFTSYLDDVPVAIFGVVEVWPGHYSVFGFGTENWNKCALSMAKHCIRVLLPTLARLKYKQATAWGMTKHEDGRRWCRLTKASEVATIANYGKNGQSFTCYSWTRDNTTGDNYVS